MWIITILRGIQETNNQGSPCFHQNVVTVALYVETAERDPPNFSRQPLSFAICNDGGVQPMLSRRLRVRRHPWPSIGTASGSLVYGGRTCGARFCGGGRIIVGFELQLQ